MKERIIEAVAEWVYSKGLKSLTMDDLAQQLGMSKKTIYQYFENKESILNCWIGEKIKLHKKIIKDSSEKAKDTIHSIFLTCENMHIVLEQMNPLFLDELCKHHPDCFKKIVQFKKEFLFHKIQKDIQQGIKEKLFRNDLNLHVATAWRMVSLFLPFNQEWFPAHRYNFIETNHQLIELFIYSIATPEGIKKFKRYKSIHNEKN